MLTRLTRTAAGTKTLVMEEGVATGCKVLKVTAIWRDFRTPQQIECRDRNRLQVEVSMEIPASVKIDIAMQNTFLMQVKCHTPTMLLCYLQ